MLTWHEIMWSNMTERRSILNLFISCGLLLAGSIALLFGTDYVLTNNGVSSYNFYPLWHLPTSVVWGSTTSTTLSVSYLVNYIGIGLLFAGIAFAFFESRRTQINKRIIRVLFGS